jgi:hypothetical protein
MSSPNEPLSELLNRDAIAADRVGRFPDSRPVEFRLDLVVRDRSQLAIEKRSQDGDPLAVVQDGGGFSYRAR